MSRFRMPSGIALAVISLAVLPVQSAPMTHGIDLDGIDHTVAPGDDFFAYANGAWIKRTEIPADKASYGPGEILIEKTREQVRGLIQDAAKSKPQAGSDAQKVGDYYASYLDEAAIEAKGLSPLKGDFANVSAIKEKRRP